MMDQEKLTSLAIVGLAKNVGKTTTLGSLLDAAVHEFLHAVASGLAEFRPGVGPATLPRSHDEILRSAARLLMHQPAWAAGNPAGAAGLFLACDRLSAMRYEGGEGRGSPAGRVGGLEDGDRCSEHGADDQGSR